MNAGEGHTKPTNVKVPRRNRKSSRKAGASFEQSIAMHMAAELEDDRIERRTKNGKNDRGDITGVKTIRGGRVVIETKDYGGRFEVGSWLNECAVEVGNDDAAIGVVVAKRRGKSDPAEQVVFMTMRDFTGLLLGGAPDLRGLAADAHVEVQS